MAHDTHFLSRLERVTPSHVELALSLYRDPELLRELFERVELGDRVERVAIALDAGEEAPHLVVARNGHFVTCLGPGMTVGELPIISRARLDAAASQLAELRRRIESAKRATGEGEDSLVDRLLLDVVRHGSHVSRECMGGLVGLRPLLSRHLQRADSLANDVIKQARTLAFDRSRPYDDDVAAHYWRGLWAQLHLDFLSFLEPAVVQRYLENTRTLGGTPLFGISMMVEGPWNAGLCRGTWLASRHADQFLAPYKRGLREASDFSLPAVQAALAAMALRHRKLAAEVEKLLKDGIRNVELARLLLEGAREQLAEAGLKSTAFEAAGEAWRALGIERHEDLPLDLAYAWLARDEQHPTGRSSKVFGVILAAAGARLAPEELYFPQRVLDALGQPDPVACGRELLDRHVELFRKRPVKAAATPGRNDPCSCGSGKKYKRCHGA